MHTHLIDHYQPQKSPIHQLDARIKVLFTLAFILSCSLLPTAAWPAYILLGCLLISILLISDLNILSVLKRSLFALPFILAAMPLVFRNSEPLLAVFIIGKIEISISWTGLIRFTSIGIKSWLSILAATLLASTTSFPQLLTALRALKIPMLLVAILNLMWRYLSLMVEETDRMLRARLSRSSQSQRVDMKPGGKLAWRARVAGGMAGSLFIRSLERSERIYSAMLSRGYDGEIRTVDHPAMGLRNILGITLALFVLALIVILSNWFIGVS